MYARKTPLSRRSFIKYLGVAAAACPSCLAAAGLVARDGKNGIKKAGETGVNWAYEGANGPQEWGALSPQYRVCGDGSEQSPINLSVEDSTHDHDLKINYHRMPLRVENSGRTIDVNCNTGSGITMDGDKFELLQFHFHHPSEHFLEGRRFEMEAHFVHAASDGRLAVLGVLIEIGQAHPLIADIWKSMPATAGPERKVASTMILPSDLLPDDRRFLRYAGSLTTPPCSQIVTWSVFRQPVTVSAEQVAAFTSLFPRNARPMQPLNRRVISRSR